MEYEIAPVSHQKTLNRTKRVKKNYSDFGDLESLREKYGIKVSAKR